MHPANTAPQITSNQNPTIQSQQKTLSFSALQLIAQLIYNLIQSLHQSKPISNNTNGTPSDPKLATQTTAVHGRPIDFNFSMNDKGQVEITHKASQESILLPSNSMIQFSGVNNKVYTLNELINNTALTDRHNISIYGDGAKNRLLVMNNKSFEKLQEIAIDDGKPVSGEYITANKSYVSVRGGNYIQILDRDANGQFEKGKKIPLEFTPRALQRNDQNGLILITGMDKPMFSLVDINTDTIVATAGRTDKTQDTIKQYGGPFASAHAHWINRNQFLVADRESNEITLYQTSRDRQGQWQVSKQNTITLPESIHTLFGEKTEKDVTTLFAPGEGHKNVQNTDAKLYELTVQGNNLALSRQTDVAGGLHHPAVLPNGREIYAATTKGTVQVINADTMQVIKEIPAGKGAAHVMLVPNRDMAVIVNHKDTFVTVIDTKTHEKIKDIEVAIDNPDVDTFLQAHSARLSDDGKYFYNFAADNGTYFRVNLDTLSLDGEIVTGGTPMLATPDDEIGYG